MKFEVEERFILIEKALHARVNEHKTEKDFSSNLRTVDGKPQQKYSFSRIIVVQEGTWYPSVRTYGRYQYLVVRTKMYSHSMKIYHDLLFEVASRSQSSVCTTQMLNCSFLFYSCNQYVYQ